MRSFTEHINYIIITLKNQKFYKKETFITPPEV